MKLELPEKKKLVYTLTLPIRWGDMDSYRHINNTVYFRYM
jgi:acyl-CoA thioester hydrolase